MKKIVIILVLIAACTYSQAQLGVKAGINLSKWRGDDVPSEEADMLVGFYVGGFYNVKISDMFSFQPDLVFSAEGVKASSGDGKNTTAFINLAPLIRFNSNGFFVGAGPQIGFLMSAKSKFSGSSIDIKDELKSTNFSLAFMTGYELKSGFGFYARYNLGLSSIADASDTDIKTSVIAIGLRYSFMGMKDGKGAKK